MSEEKDGKKGRKPYTITKPRESWTKEEHEYFLEALQLYERDWKKIGQHIPTKSIIQIRSHAQKYFIKMAKMGLKEYIPAPSRPVKRTKSKGGASNGGPKKKQKREGATSAQAGEEDDEGEEEEEEGEDGEDEEGEDDGDDGQEGMEGEGNDEEMDDEIPAAAASTNGTRKPLPSPSKMVRSTSKGKSAKQPAAAAAAAASAVIRKPVMKRQDSSSSMELDDGSRRSGRKRKANPRYDEEEGEEQGGEEYLDEEGMDPEAEGLEGEEEGIEMEGEEGEEHEDGQRSNRSSAGPNAYDGAARGLISQLGDHAPSTPLRKAVGGALNSLSQLSPLSQLTQAGSLADITSPHLLPATAYNPKLKPYPGLHQQQRAAAAGIGLGGAKGAGGLALPNRPNPPPQPTPLNIAADDGSQGHDGGDDEDDKPMAPELSKVYTYLASLFDPSSTGHVDELEKMAPVNKEVVQKLMQNLTTNLPSLSASDATSSTSDTISSILNPNARSRQAPKHIRTTSLGNLTNLDVLGSPSADLALYGNPSVSPNPVSTVINSSTTLSNTGSSPQPFLRTFSSGGNGLTVNITPASGSSSATTNAASTSNVVGSSNTIGNGSGTTLPPAPGGSSWGQDKTRPGFASNALVSRITARSALSPLSVAPLTTNWPTTQGSPTAPSGSLGTYSSYAYASMSPSTNTPLSFVGSPGAFFSPSLGGGVAGGPDTSNQPALLQFPTSAAPASSTTSSTTTTHPNPTTTSSTLTVPVSSSGIGVTPTKPSAPPTLNTTTPPTSTTTGLSLISPASAAAGNVLAQLISSGSPPKKTEVQ